VEIKQGGNPLRKQLWYVLPIAVTIIALGVALSRFNLTQLWQTGMQLPAWVLAVVLLELLAGSMLACWRVKVIAEGLNQILRFRDAVVATATGNLVGSFFFQIIGQTIARSAVFLKVGISVQTTIVIAGYERIVAAAVSLSLALGGTFFLFRHITFDLAGGGLNLLTIVAGFTTVALSGALFAWGSRAGHALRTAATVNAVILLIRASVITILIQATTMIAYVAAASSLSPSTPLINLIAALALVMFAASVPISLAGWGLREVSAVYALGAIGVPYRIALVVALLIGFSSIVVMAIVALVSSRLVRFEAPPASTKSFDAASARAAAHHAAFLNWFIPLFAGSAVFFQIYVPVGVGELNVNLADSVVLFGGALFALRAFARGASPLAVRVPWLGTVIALMSAVITFAFFHGLYVYGWTSWAFTNRFFGWLVLLCYAGTGALLTLETNAGGLETLLRTFVASGLAVVAFELILLFAVALNVPIPPSVLPLRFEGFAQNPNAFGFQLLLVIAAAIALRVSGWRQHVALGLAFMGVYFTASRAAEGTAVILCAAAIGLRYVSARSLFMSLGYAAAGVGIIFSASWASSEVAQWLTGHSIGAGHNALAGYFSTNAYQLIRGDPGSGLNADRWLSLADGIRMFFAHPVFGAGLGAFIEVFEREHGRFLIIHSTPIWLLAETGAVGFLVFAVPCVVIFFREVRVSLARKRWDTGGTLLVLSMLAFGVMSQVHELLYQRPLWLVLGAALFSPVLALCEARVTPRPDVGMVAPEEVINPAAARGV